MLQLTTILFLISFSLLAALHHIAIKLFLYWSVWWFDLPMHFFGGAVIALGVFTLRDLRIIPSAGVAVARVLAFVAFVAIIWEIYEVMIGISLPIDTAFFIDTSIDLFLGIVGGYVGYIIGSRLRDL